MSQSLPHITAPYSTPQKPGFIKATHFLVGCTVMKISNSYYTAHNRSISGKDKTENIALSAKLTQSNKDIPQPVYTAQIGSITKIGLQYIQS